MDSYRQFVESLERIQREARALPLGGVAPVPRASPRPDAPVALLLSPHPDDEIINGGLPLRLMREAGWRIVNVAVTLGSNPARRAERWNEARAACAHVGFELVPAAPDGLSGVKLPMRAQDPANWAANVRAVADIIARHAPRAVFLPHAHDGHPAHVGTHRLVVDALAALGPALQVHVVETEFWGAMETPNLMIELATATLADLVTALGFHTGEVRRNPYHLSLPAWMIDNVRRGAELVLGSGAVAPALTFATLYRVRRWRDGGFVPSVAPGYVVAAAGDVALPFAE